MAVLTTAQRAWISLCQAQGKRGWDKYGTLVNMTEIWTCILLNITLFTIVVYIMNKYYDAASSASFGGVRRLYDSLGGKSYASVRQYLAGQDTYTLHKPARKKFPRRKYLVRGIDDLWQADLADLTSISRQNSGNKYLLVVIDVFSKHLWVEPIKNKKASTTLDALKVVLVKASPRKPTHFMTDKGTEFAYFKKYLTDANVNYYTSENAETKASIAERVIRTLKGRIFRFFTASKTVRYIDTLQDFVKSYNNSKHRSIGMRPVDVNESTEEEVRDKLYPQRNLLYPPKFIFKIGDKVRIALSHNPFAKGYKKQWSDEIFTVSKQQSSYPPVYEITDSTGQTIKGTFYEPELQNVV